MMLRGKIFFPCLYPCTMIIGGLLFVFRFFLVQRVALRKLFNHLREERIRLRSQALSSLRWSFVGHYRYQESLQTKGVTDL